MPIKQFSAVLLTVALAFTSCNSVYAGNYKRTFGFILAAVVSGAVSGYVAAEVTERYTAKKASIRGDRFVVENSAIGYSMAHRGKKETHISAGDYPIVSRGIHDESGTPYIIINDAQTDDDLIIFTERA